MRQGDAAGVEAAVRAGAQLDKLSKIGKTQTEQSALHYAATINKIEVAEKLLILGADIENANSYGKRKFNTR